MAEGVDGLLRDKGASLGRSRCRRRPLNVVDLTLGPPPGETTHWTARLLAKAVGISLRSVQRILDAHQLTPHHIQTFTLSKDSRKPVFVLLDAGS
jgi:hypothetical protein